MHDSASTDKTPPANSVACFTLSTINPEQYRQQTRKATWIIIAVFIVLAMLFSSTLVMLFGEAGGDNFRLNLAGVVAGVILTAGLVRQIFNKKSWMAANMYGWRLKRSLMSVTNVMHHVTAGVTEHNHAAIKLLRFYHLGLMQMHQLDGNTSEISQMVHEVDQHKSLMQELSIEAEQQTLDPAWIQAVKAIKAQKTL